MGSRIDRHRGQSVIFGIKEPDLFHLWPSPPLQSHETTVDGSWPGSGAYASNAHHMEQNRVTLTRLSRGDGLSPWVQLLNSACSASCLEAGPCRQPPVRSGHHHCVGASTPRCSSFRVPGNPVPKASVGEGSRLRTPFLNSVAVVSHRVSPWWVLRHGLMYVDSQMEIENHSTTPVEDAGR